LVIASGTTTLDLSGAAYFIRNYTSVSITGTGQLDFVNPHAAGTIIVLRSQGDTTLTSSALPAIDVSGLGSSDVMADPLLGGSCPTGLLHKENSDIACRRNSITQQEQYLASYYLAPLEATRSLRLAVGQAGAKYNVDGGRGGGALYIEVADQLDFTGTIYANGEPGGTGAMVGFGSGGGSGGRVIILYNVAGVLTGTMENQGGAGGAGIGDTAFCGLCGAGGVGAGGFGGAGGDATTGTTCGCSGGMVHGGGGGAGGGGPGGIPGPPGTSSTGGAGGPSGNNILQQNTVFP
jgi:hypothetical protein